MEFADLCLLAALGYLYCLWDSTAGFYRRIGQAVEKYFAENPEEKERLLKDWPRGEEMTMHEFLSCYKKK